jgi:hypothetical protein
MTATRYAIYRQDGDRPPVLYGRRPAGARYRMRGRMAPATYRPATAHALASRMTAMAYARHGHGRYYYAAVPIA